ncbi:hypothetical protein EYZ11_013054 [Aspergillus tanneri]|nr:hypothetical protein EYZ11_013054 [Aspergillus tanneri]
MAAYAVGNEVYLASSARGPPLIYKTPSTHGGRGGTREGLPPDLERALSACSQRTLVSAQHKNDASCGEMNIFLMYHERERPALPKGGKMVAWSVTPDINGKIMDEKIVDPCWGDSLTEYGCQEVMGELRQGISVLAGNTRPEAYNPNSIQAMEWQPLFYSESTRGKSPDDVYSEYCE